VITPLEDDQLGAASIDLTLGDEIRVIERSAEPSDLPADSDYRDHTRVAPLDEPYVLAPGSTIHGITRERIQLPGNLCGFLEGRSRFARLGLIRPDAHRGRGLLRRSLRPAVRDLMRAQGR
jgi:dCTP deaminase